MSKRHTNHTQPPSIQYIVNYELVNGVVIDTVSGNAYNTPNTNNTAAVSSGSDWFYSTNGTNSMAANYIYDNGGTPTSTAIFSHKTGVLWRDSGQTPNPPTNGVCPGYFSSGGLRWESEFYVKQTWSQMQFLLGDFKTNNTRQNGHFGFVVNCNTSSVRTYDASGGLKYCECANNYHTITYYQQYTGYTAATANNPQILRLDFTETEHRMRLIDKTTMQPIADSGVRSHPHPSSGTARLYALEHSTADGSHGKVALAFRYVRLSESSQHSDFMQ